VYFVDVLHPNVLAGYGLVLQCPLCLWIVTGMSALSRDWYWNAALCKNWCCNVCFDDELVLACLLYAQTDIEMSSLCMA
jgi:hypothetical protein